MSDEAGQGITLNGLYAVIWTLVGVSTVLLGGRLLIRSLLLKTFHLDDVFAALSWLLMIVCMICSTLEAPISYQYSRILIGESPMPSEAEFADITIEVRRWNVASQMLFWTSLYCVKLSFMFLYRVVSGDRRIFGHAWLAGLTYIILSYGICLIGVFGQCGDARHLWSYEQCMTPYVTSLDARLIWVDYFFNVSSDLIVVVLPMPAIWRLHMRIQQKLALFAICSLALITIAFETVRSVKIYQENSNLTNLYSYLELLISVLISMLPSYRFLISPSDKDREYRRLFWSRITMTSYHSTSSMQNYDLESRAIESRRTVNKATEASEDPPPLTTAH